MIMLLTNCEISCFRRGVNEVFALLGCYAALIVSKLLVFQDSYRRLGMTYLPHIQGLVFLDCLTLKMGPISCAETSVNYNQSALRNIPEERRPHDIIIIIIIINIIIRGTQIFQKSRSDVKILGAGTETWSKFVLHKLQILGDATIQHLVTRRLAFVHPWVWR